MVQFLRFLKALRGHWILLRLAIAQGKQQNRWRWMPGRSLPRILTLGVVALVFSIGLSRLPSWSLAEAASQVALTPVPASRASAAQPTPQLTVQPTTNPSVPFKIQPGVIQPPLSTRGAEIVDAKGRSVVLRGVNWFGLETSAHAPHGLWARDYKEMLAQMKGLGYNLIRLPYSVKGLQETTVSGINFDLGSNAELRDKTPLEVMDAIVQEAGRQGLLILLDSHRLNTDRIPELWYGDGVSEDDWIKTWTTLAERYQKQPNVIGADLKNEPHGKASWGTYDRATDWRLAAERAGNAILKVNRNWLIVVEGVQNNVPRQLLPKHWMGGNLEGVRKFPVRLTLRNRVVYSPHEYGAGVFDQPWFNEKSFPNNLSDRWEKGFFYIAKEKIAPILIGEFGGRSVDATSKEGIWQRQFVEFVKRNQLHFAYWSWNPNSADTGGLVQDDWTTIEQPKQDLLNALLPVQTMRSMPSEIAANAPRTIQLSSAVALPIPSPGNQPIAKPEKPTATPPAKPTSTTQPIAQPGNGALTALEPKLMFQSDWAEGFCVSLQVTNRGTAIAKNWRLSFQMQQATIDQRWNGTFEQRNSQTGMTYVVTPQEWARSLQPNQTVDLGFCAKKSGPNYRPTAVTIVSE